MLNLTQIHVELSSMWQSQSKIINEPGHHNNSNDADKN